MGPSNKKMLWRLKDLKGHNNNNNCWQNKTRGRLWSEHMIMQDGLPRNMIEEIEGIWTKKKETLKVLGLREK